MKKNTSKRRHGSATEQHDSICSYFEIYTINHVHVLYGIIQNISNLVSEALLGLTKLVKFFWSTPACSTGEPPPRFTLPTAISSTDMGWTSDSQQRQFPVYFVKIQDRDQEANAFIVVKYWRMWVQSLMANTTTVPSNNFCETPCTKSWDFNIEQKCIT